MCEALPACRHPETSTEQLSAQSRRDPPRTTSTSTSNLGLLAPCCSSGVQHSQRRQRPAACRTRARSLGCSPLRCHGGVGTPSPARTQACGGVTGPPAAAAGRLPCVGSSALGSQWWPRGGLAFGHASSPTLLVTTHWATHLPFSPTPHPARSAFMLSPPSFQLSGSTQGPSQSKQCLRVGLPAPQYLPLIGRHRLSKPLSSPRILSSVYFPVPMAGSSLE